MKKDPRHPFFVRKFTEEESPILEEFPFDLMEELSEIQSLSVKYHEIREISDRIGEMTSLLYLELRSLPLAELPEAFGKLKSLKFFRASEIFRPEGDAYYRRLMEGPMHEATFRSDTGLKNLPGSFSQLKELEHLRLDGNRFQEFPKEILELKELTYLDLSRNFIRTIPAEIGKLNKLSYLQLSRNNFHRLPDSIAQLKQLKRLRLDSLVLEGLPAGIGDLESLEMLEICQGELHSIPLEIKHLYNLTDLYLIDTEIDEIDMNALRVFLPHTRIHTELPDF